MRRIATYIATGATAVAMAITPAAAEKMKDSKVNAEDRVEMQDEQTLDQAELRGTKTKDNMITKHQKDALGADEQNEEALDQAELRGTKTKDNVITKHQKDVLDTDKKDIDPDKADAKLDDPSNESADAGEADTTERTSQAETETDSETMSN